MFVQSAGILSIWRESIFIDPQENLHVMVCVWCVCVNLDESSS